MDISTLLNGNLTTEQQSLKTAFELIASLLSEQSTKNKDDPLSPVVEQLRQSELLLKHQLEFERNRALSFESQNKELQRKAELIDNYKKDHEFEVSQNLKLVDAIAKAHEERRLVEAKNEHLRTEFATKINLLNQSIKDHRDNFNALEREKKKQDIELKALREELFTCKLALGKYETVGTSS
ncbi:hypothetical protein [Undibacterium sp.]|uniref:hypothetical protein n=1 Tax=Undibacterium sp. TaxID=1914977 RepID=UPI0037524759